MHKLVVDIQHFRHICQLEDKYARNSADAFDKETPPLAANIAIESPKQKRKRNRKSKYAPNKDSNPAPTANMVVKPVSTTPTPNLPTTAGYPNNNSNDDRSSSSTPKNKRAKGRPENQISPSLVLQINTPSLISIN